MKAVLSNRIYLEADYLLQDKLDQTLTYSIPSPLKGKEPMIIKTMTRINKNIVSIPIGRTDLIPEGYEIVDKRVLVPLEFPKFKYDLRDSQQKVYEDVAENCIINASVSWGKTFTAIAIAAKLGQKTLVVTHNVGIRNQWVKEIEKTLGFTPGIIGSGKFNTSTPIVVGNTQTLFKNVQSINKDFGTLIIDEMHHTPSRTFSKVIDSSYARYKIGLSGTVKRKDGRHVVFRDYFGNIMYKPPKENYMKPVVHIIRTGIRFPGNPGMPWAVRINELVAKDEYRHLVSAVAASYAAKGHKVLLVSDRVHFLNMCQEFIGPTAMLVTGSTSEEERDQLEKRLKTNSVICGTQSIFSEGISINPLSCLILGTPVHNEPLLEQLIGRIVRVYPDKLTPVVVDLWLKGGIAERQAQARLGHYMKQGYNISYF